MGKRGALAEMRLVGKEVLVEDGLGRGVGIIGAHTEDMVGVATRHASGKAERVGALEVGSRVDREATGRWGRKRLVSLHGLLGRRQERASEARNIVRGCARDRGDRRWRGSREENRDRSGKGGSVFQFAVDSFGDEFFLVTE